MVYSKVIVIFAVKRQNDKKIGWISASFPLSASRSLLSVTFLLSKENRKIIKPIFFLSVLASMTGHWV